MDVILQRKSQEALADMAKILWNFYHELKREGFSTRQAFELTKKYLLQSLWNMQRKWEDENV